MRHGKIFMVEMTFSDLELMKMPEINANDKSCVLLRLFEHIEMEICDKKLGSHVNLQDVSNGSKCIFSLFNEDDAALVHASINVFKKDEQDKRVFVGRYDLNLEEILKKLMKGTISMTKKESIYAQSKAISVVRSGMSHMESIFKENPEINSSNKSLKSEPMHFDSNNEPVAETIKGLFPLFNHDDDNIGFIVLTIRISCYGNVMMHPKVEDDTSTLYFSEKPSAIESAVDLNHLQMYKKSKNDEFVCPECPDCSLLSFKSSVKDSIETVKPSSSEESTSKVPPTSLVELPVPSTEEFDEFVQEINGNAMIIRISKGAGMKIDILQPEKEKNENIIGYARDHDNVTIKLPQNNECNPVINHAVFPSCKCLCHHERVCPRKCAKLPVIKGNLKYPNKYPLHMSKVMEPSSVRDGSSEEDKKRESQGMQDPISQKASTDPKQDSYVLKLGKKKPGVGHLEIELRTPTCAESLQKSENTVAVQVIEEEFEDYKSYKVGKKDDDKKGKKGKADKKKGKGKKK